MQATRAYIEGLTEALASETGVKFKQGKNWRVNIKDRTFEYDPVHLQNFDHNFVKGLILHETGHLKYTKQDKPTKLQQKHPAMQLVYNCLEDIRIEHLLNKQYGNFSREGLDTINAYGFQEIAKKLRRREITSPLHRVLLGLSAFCSHLQSGSSVASESSGTAYENIPIATRVFIDRSFGSIQDNILGPIKSFATTQELLDWVDREIHPKIKDLLEDADKQEVMQAVQEVVKSGLGHTLGSQKTHAGIDEEIPSDRDLKYLLNPYINTLAVKLGNILKERKAIKLTGSYKTGKLLSKNAYKVFTEERRIFSKRNKPDTPHYSITFVLDNSGSMQGQKQTNAYIGAYLILEACKRLGFKTRVIKYDADAYNITLEDYRRVASGDNNDFLAVDFAYKQIDKTDDNIIFMLTDGAVCNNPSEAIARFQKDRIPFVPIGVGLNNGELAQLRCFYPNPLNAQRPEDLPRLLISKLSSIIHR